MNVFAGDELLRFFKAVDAHLKKPARLVVIGGAAASISLGLRRGTVDIDAASDIGAVRDACAAARKRTGLDIPLAAATTYEAPARFESRLERVHPDVLKKLKLWTPEKHDWALMKMARFMAKDIEDIKGVARARGFDRTRMIPRFLEEMAGPGRPKDRLSVNFLAMVEELWGGKEAERVESVLRRHPNWRRTP